MIGAVTLFPYMPLWREQGQLAFLPSPLELSYTDRDTMEVQNKKGNGDCVLNIGAKSTHFTSTHKHSG
jgi:hypothetical protein